MTMPIPDNAIKGFYIYRESWYGQDPERGPSGREPEIVDEINIGFYEPGEGTFGEFALQFKPLGRAMCVKLAAWSDSWLALSKMPELLALLAANGTDSGTDDQPVSWWKEQLLALGFRDFTSREQN